MKTRLTKRWWAVTILIVYASSQLRIMDRIFKTEIYLTILFVLAFFVAGVGRALIFWSLVAFLALALLSILLIHPFAVLTGWFVAFSGASAVCTGTGVRYLYDLSWPLHRFRIFSYPMQFGDRLTRILLTRAHSRLLRWGFWIESLAINTLSALCLSVLASVLAAYLVVTAGQAPSWERAKNWANALFRRPADLDLLSIGLWLACFMFFFGLFMWRSLQARDPDEPLQRKA